MSEPMPYFIDGRDPAVTVRWHGEIHPDYCGTCGEPLQRHPSGLGGRLACCDRPGAYWTRHQPLLADRWLVPALRDWFGFVLIKHPFWPKRRQPAIPNE